MPIERRARLWLALALAGVPAHSPAAGLTARVAPGPPEQVFKSRSDGCAPIDTPDIDPRAFRAADGAVTLFTLHYVNRALRGADLSSVKIDCHVALDSAHDPDPAHYDDRRYIAAAWTADGQRVAALVHHEYHADDHDRCSATTSLGCWHNTILAFSSRDGGRSFAMDRPAVVASAPFTQDQQQGRHRGFFNPSNIFSDGRYEYFFASTTGWSGQPYGACVFRNANPFDSGGWRAWDGATFSVAYADPYVVKHQAPRPCAPIAPFGLPVGSVTRHVATGTWFAVWMAPGDRQAMPVAGIYYATSANLFDWSPPRLLLAGKVILNPGCGGNILAYPSVLDENQGGRDFDHMGDAPWLYYVSIAMNGCDTGERALERARLSISGGGEATP